MRRIQLLFTSVRSLGSLGVILLLGVAIIAISAINYFAVLDAVFTVYDDMMRVDLLKDAVEFNILEQGLYAGYYADYWDADYLTWARENGGDLSEALGEYESDEYFTFPPEQADTLDAMREVQATQTTLLQDLEVAVTAEDEAATDELQWKLEDGTDELNAYLASLVFDGQMDLAASSRQVWQTVEVAVAVSAGSLVALPLLTIWAFSIASRMARPVLALATALTALGGGQFRTALTADTARRHNLFGRLARAIEALAADTQVQEKAREAEIQELRKELHISRRRKIVFTTPR